MSDNDSSEYTENDIKRFTGALTAYKDIIDVMEKQNFALVKIERDEGILLTFQNCLHNHEFAFNDKVLKAASEIDFKIEDDYSAGIGVMCVYVTVHLAYPDEKGDKYE